MAQVKFYSATLDKYNALQTKDANALYIVEDAGKIFKGANDVTSDVTVVASVPDTLVEGKVAFVKVTANAQTMYDVYIGTAGNVPVKAVPGFVSDKDAFNSEATFCSYLPTVSAVKGFVEDKLADTATKANKAIIDAAYADGTLTFNHANGSEATTAVLTGVAHNITWDPDAYKLTVKNFGQDDIEINIPKDFFLQDGKFEPSHVFEAGTDKQYTSPAIVLTVNIQNGEQATAKEIAIPVKDLVDTYTVGSTNTVTLTMDAQHNITAAVKFQEDGADTDKILVKSTSGIGQATKSVKDIEDDIDSKVAAAKKEITDVIPGAGAAGKVIVSTATGSDRSAASIGGETIAADPTANVLATEKAVRTAVDAATGTLHSTVTDEIATAKSEAINTAAKDATTKSDAAREAAKTYAETKASEAQAAAEKTAADALKSAQDSLTGNIDGKADKATTLAGYGIEDAYTKGETDTAINTAVAKAGHLKRAIVAALPEVDQADPDTIYMVPDDGNVSDPGSAKSTYTEYMLINGSFERIGTSDTDLSNYYTKTQVDTNIDTAKTEAATDAQNKADAAKTAAVAEAKTETTSQVNAAKEVLTTAFGDADEALHATITGETKTAVESAVNDAMTWNEL